MNGFITLDKTELIQKQSGTIKIQSVTNWLALYNCNVYWVIPESGKDVKDIPEHTVSSPKEKRRKLYDNAPAYLRRY